MRAVSSLAGLQSSAANGLDAALPFLNLRVHLLKDRKNLTFSSVTERLRC